MPSLKKWIEVLPSEVVDGLLTSWNGLLKASLEVLADFANLFGNLEPAAVAIPAPPSSSEFGVQLMTSRKGVEETSKRGWGEIVRRGVSTDCCCSSIYAWNLAVPKLIFKIGRKKNHSEILLVSQRLKVIVFFMNAMVDLWTFLADYKV